METQTLIIKNPGPQEIIITISLRGGGPTTSQVAIAPGAERTVKFLPDQALTVETFRSQ